MGGRPSEDLRGCVHAEPRAEPAAESGRVALRACSRPQADPAAANPCYCATDLNRHTGFRSAEEGAQVSVHLATLPADGPTGILWGFLWNADGPGSFGPLPW